MSLDSATHTSADEGLKQNYFRNEGWKDMIIRSTFILVVFVKRINEFLLKYAHYSAFRVLYAYA